MFSSLEGAGRILLIFCFLVLVFSSDSRGQRGAIAQPRNVIQLTARAESIFHGRVIHVRVEAHPRHPNLTSVLVTMSVQQTLKGISQKTFSFRQFIWDPRDRAEQAGYRAGDEFVLFLNRATEIGFTSPVGLEQGRFRVLRGAGDEPMAVNGANNRGLLLGTEEFAKAPRLSPKARMTMARPAEQGGAVPLRVLKEVVHELVTDPGGTQ